MTGNKIKPAGRKTWGCSCKNNQTMGQDLYQVWSSKINITFFISLNILIKSFIFLTNLAK